MMYDDDFDERAGAHLDGDAADAAPGVAIVARAAVFGEVREALRAGGGLDPLLVDDMVHAALAVYDVEVLGMVPEPVVAADTSPVLAPALDLDAARRRRTARWWKPVAAVAGAAAIGVAAVSGMGTMSADSQDSATDVAFEAPAETFASAEVSDLAAADDAAKSAAPADAAPAASEAPAEELITAIEADQPATVGTVPTAGGAEAPTGSTTTLAVPRPAFTTEEELLAYAEAFLSTGDAAAATTAATTLEDDPPCAPGTDLGPITWRGTDGVLYAVDDDGAPGVDRLVVVDATCTSLLELSVA